MNLDVGQTFISLLSISVKSAQTSAIRQGLIQNVPVSINFATQKFFDLLFNGAKSNPKFN